MGLILHFLNAPQSCREIYLNYLHCDVCLCLLIAGRLTFLFYIVYLFVFQEVVSNEYIDKCIEFNLLFMTSFQFIF